MEQQSFFGNFKQNNPLASRLRPENLDDFCGQRHLLGHGKILRQLSSTAKPLPCFAAHDDSASTAIALLNRQSSI